MPIIKHAQGMDVIETGKKDQYFCFNCSAGEPEMNLSLLFKSSAASFD